MKAGVVIVVRDEGAEFRVKHGGESVDKDVDLFARGVVARGGSGEIESVGGGK